MKIRDELISAFERDKNKKTIITAHSSGSAFAIFFALDINELYRDKEVTLIIFGMPKIGNHEFVSFLKNKEKIYQEHVTTNDDIVTKFPLNKKYEGLNFQENIENMESFNDLHKTPFYYYLLNLLNLKKLLNSHSMKEYSHNMNTIF